MPWTAQGPEREATRKADARELLRRIRGRLRGASFDQHGNYDAEVSEWSSAIGDLCPEPALYAWREPPLSWTATELAGICTEVGAALDEARVEARTYHAQRWVCAAERVGVGDPELRSALRELARAMHRNTHDRDAHKHHREVIAQIAGLLGEPSLVGPDAWRRALDADPSPTAVALLALGDSAPTRPSPRFAKQHALLVERHGEDACRACAVALLRAAAAARATTREPPVIPAQTVDVLVGLVRVVSTFDGDEVADALADLGIAAYRKIPHFGACSGPLGTACSRALAGRPEALAQLARMHQRTTHPLSKRKLERLLADVADRLGVSQADLTEIVVPELGLRDGSCTHPVGDATYRLTVEADAIVGRWIGADGRQTRTAPIALREAHAPDVAEAKARTRALRDALGVQRARMETLLREDREWPLEAWQVRYLEHGLVGTLARRLVWRFADADGERAAVVHGGRLIDPLGEPLAPLQGGVRVRLWHPAGAVPGEQEALRALLAQCAITQPFAQVEREVFRPDAGDMNAGAVGRFAGRRVRQHQLAAILRGRGWRYELRSAAWDSDDAPTLDLRAWGLSAELDLAHDPGEPTSDRSIVLGVTCGDLRFTAVGTPRAAADVPLVAFSEVLRDVALVVTAAEDRETT